MLIILNCRRNFMVGTASSYRNPRLPNTLKLRMWKTRVMGVMMNDTNHQTSFPRMVSVEKSLKMTINSQYRKKGTCTLVCFFGFSPKWRYVDSRRVQTRKLAPIVLPTKWRHRTGSRILIHVFFLDKNQRVDLARRINTNVGKRIRYNQDDGSHGLMYKAT